MADKNNINNKISDEKLLKYFEITSKALGLVRIGVRKNSPLYQAAIDFLEMAKRYYNDAVYFKNKGDYVNAFAAVSYAHGWLDAGARIGLFNVNDSFLFTVD